VWSGLLTHQLSLASIPFRLPCLVIFAVEPLSNVRSKDLDVVLIEENTVPAIDPLGSWSFLERLLPSLLVKFEQVMPLQMAVSAEKQAEITIKTVQVGMKKLQKTYFFYFDIPGMEQADHFTNDFRPPAVSSQSEWTVWKER